ncbi:hypothetical protein [Phaeobacter inhibens]|uniref:hypothetical protein n=1 Tax=Phaeobacter inhibens TaxID=221822 RepID=UPI0021A65C55|nr:hypothetical protein [Phaeobacter inhibens]UWR59114.1 hypothetical protein K4F88_09130 [Phaeobacter inhibens]
MAAALCTLSQPPQAAAGATVMKPMILTFEGVTQSVTEWALDYGITPKTITQRLRYGWSVERAITTPVCTRPGKKLSGAYLDAAIGMKKTAPKTRSKPTRKPAKVRRSSNIYLTFDGQERSLSDWVKLTGIKHATLRYRLKNGWPVADILNEPVMTGTAKRLGKKRRASDIYLTFNGVERNLSEWAKLCGIHHKTLRFRLKNGWSVEDALTKPVRQMSRPGVVSNFGDVEGTGGGRSAQDSPNISFSEKEAC